jgi:hypothetical protein
MITKENYKHQGQLTSNEKVKTTDICLILIIHKNFETRKNKWKMNPIFIRK